jgi:HD superfamily phosphohydrolase
MHLDDNSFLSVGHHIARLDGVDDQLWEPVWQLRTQLRPVERALLTTWPLRRLHFLHHGGAAYLAMPHTYSRLQHTLGVFALIVHFRPDDELLRLAALLHDVGHPPFSHTLEQLARVDHHRWTIDGILSPPIAGILHRHGLNPQAVLACIAGRPANLLRNQDGFVHADHLDSWVRSAHTSGLLPRPAPDLLARLRADGAYLDTDIETAEILLSLIMAEARFHTSAVNLGASTMLVHLVQRAFETGALTADALPGMTDGMLERLLFEAPATAEAARRLWHLPHTILARRLEDEDAPPGAHLVPVDRLYLSVPLTNGRPITEVSPRAAALVAGAQKLLGTYAVFWADGDSNV